MATRSKPSSGEMSAWSASGNYMKWQGVIHDLSVQYNSFGLSNEYIMAQIKQFLFNFIWLLILIALVFWAFGMIRRKNHYNIIEPLTIIIPYIVSIFFFLLITFLYVTHNHYRYKIVIFPMVYLICFLVINKFCTKALIRKICVGSMTILFLAQSFFSLDPVTSLAGKTIDIGKMSLTNFNIGMGGDSTLTEYVVYNRQGMYLGNLLEKAFTQITEAEYEVFGVSGVEYRQAVFWDKEQHILSTIDDKGKVRIGIAELQKDGKIMKYDENMQFTEVDQSIYNQIVYFDFPFCDSYDNMEILKEFPEKTVTIM